MKTVIVSVTVKVKVHVSEDAYEHELTGRELRDAIKSTVKAEMVSSWDGGYTVEEGALFDFELIG